MPRRGQQDHRSVPCDVVNALEPFEQGVVGRLECYLPPFRSRDFDVFPKHPFALGVGFRQDCPLTRADEQFGLRYVRNATDMVEM